MIATICDWCSNLHDPARNHPCPCQKPSATHWEVQRRHREAVARADRSDGRRAGTYRWEAA